MSKERATAEKLQVCPSCGQRLTVEGDLLRCPEHGEFFSYGPRLLVRVPHSDIRAPIMPWQTLSEKTVG